MSVNSQTLGNGIKSLENRTPLLLLRRSLFLQIWILFFERKFVVWHIWVYSIYREGEFVFSYNKLWKVLIDRKMLRKDLMRREKINSSTMAKMGKGQTVSMEVLGRICHVLDCNVGDIVDYIDNNSEREE